MCGFGAVNQIQALGSLHQRSLERVWCDYPRPAKHFTPGFVELAHQQCYWALSSEWWLDTYMRSCAYHIAPSARAH